jgi:5-methyltetrahydrofolate--homocysteine methyltransferase
MDFSTLMDAILKGNAQKVEVLTKAALDAGSQPVDIINNGLIPGMNKVGVLFKAGDLFVPEVMRSAKSMHAGLNLLKPLISESDIPSRGTVLIGTVKGDLHDIGKNLVIMMLEGSGYTVIDLGIDVAEERFIEAVREHKPHVLGMAALLTTTMMAMKENIDALQAAGLRDSVKIIVGGAPVSQEFADQVGADGYAADATAAVDLCYQFVK